MMLTIACHWLAIILNLIARVDLTARTGTTDFESEKNLDLQV